MSRDAAGATVNDTRYPPAGQRTDDFSDGMHAAFRMLREGDPDAMAAAGLASSPAPAGCHCGKPWEDHDVHYPDPASPAPAGWPRWECSSCRRNANQCARQTCCPDCDHDPTDVEARHHGASPAPAGLDDFGSWVRWFLDANPNAESGDLIDAIRERSQEA